MINNNYSFTEEQQNIAKKNDGFSIVMVIVAMAFVGVLVAVIMLASLYNFYTKATNRNAKDNFYTAETALEEIRAGLQIEVDKAFNVAYMSVFQDYSSNLSEKNARFGKAYRTTLVNSLQAASADANAEKQYNLTKIQGYVTRPLNTTTNVGADVNGVMVDVVKEDGTTETRPRTALVEYTDGVRLEGIQITYYDEKGYVSIITTNILLKIPELDLINPVIVPPLEDYALIANTQLQVNSTATLAGGAYGGSNGIAIEPSMNFTIQRAEFQKTINPEDHLVYVTTDKDIDVGTNDSGFANLTIEPGLEVWAGAINTFGGKLTMNSTSKLNSSIYLQDDLTIRRRNNNVNLSGRFYGFGSTGNDPGNSSAIVINGTSTTLDLSGLNTLKLAGNAYIATKKVNDNVSVADLEDDGEDEEEEEIEEPEIPEPEIIRIEKTETIKHNQLSPSSLTNSYFTYAPGKWTAGNQNHTWSTEVDSNNPQATYYEVRFTGHKIDIYSGKNFMMGKVRYFLDGEEKYLADLYRSNNIDSTYITTISDLGEGEHIFRAEATAERNPSQHGTLTIDAAEVIVYYYEVIEPEKPAKPENPKEPKAPKVPATEKLAELKSNKDIRTGSSVSSKAEQMAYLVPPQYVGWIDGRCVIGTNPVSEDVYRRFKSKIGSFAGGVNYNEVNLSADLSLSNYGAGYEKIFVRTTSGQTWVYYYLKFVNSAWADRFFEDYFRDNKNKLNAYMDSYITSIKLSPTLEASDSLNFYLAGNMITGNNSNYKLVPYTSTNLEENSKIHEEFVEYEEEFKALNKILRKGYKEMTQTQRDNSVYQNVVKASVIKNNLMVNKLYFYENEDSEKPIALITKGDYIWNKTGNDSELHMIICDGNVSVQADFKGLIIASGIISIDSAVTVSAYDLLNTAMMAETRETAAFLLDEAGTPVIQHMPLYFLVDGQEKDIRDDKEISDKTYTASDFVIYENWSKQ